MIGIVLGILIPIVYIAVGCGVGIFVYDHKPSRRCRSTTHDLHCPPQQYQRNPRLYPECKDKPCECHVEGRHEYSCDCSLVASLAGLFWPIAGIYIAVYALMKGKARKGTRVRRAQKKVQRAAKRIADLESELGL